MRPSEYFRAVWPALSSTILMAAGVMAARYALPSTLPLAVRFALEVLAGAVVYAVSMVGLHRERVKAMIRTLRLLRGGAA
jgi:hypothetical protein